MDTSSRPIRLVAIVSGLFVALLISWSSITYTIPSGHAGLVFRTFSDGINPDEAPVGQGFHFKAPWDRIARLRSAAKGSATDPRRLVFQLAENPVGHDGPFTSLFAQHSALWKSSAEEITKMP